MSPDPKSGPRSIASPDSEEQARDSGEPVTRRIGERSPPAESGKQRVRNRVRRLGRYELCFEVASGGMATVYLARTEGPSGFGKIVALKQIHPHLAKQQDFVEMFSDEARLAALINHPNVCSVTDFGQAEGGYYLTMEYLVGEPLSLVMKTARHFHGETPKVPFTAFAAKVVADAAEGLHAAHELRDPTGEPLHVVHRDVSPGNIFVTYDGGVRIVDFGIARAANRKHQTSTGQVKGKFAYMAPEQMTGSPLDRRADIWSLGVILHEMVTGRSLFKRDALPETVQAVSQDAIPRVRDVAPEVDPELDEIVHKALARDPADRYASARDMARDLTAYLAMQRVGVGMVEVGEWMHALCPEGQAEKQQLMKLAQQGDDVVPQAHSSLEEVSHSTVLDTHPADQGRPMHAEPGAPRWSKRRGALVASLAALALAGVAVASLWRPQPTAVPDPAAEAARVKAAAQSQEAARATAAAAAERSAQQQAAAQAAQQRAAQQEAAAEAERAAQAQAAAEAEALAARQAKAASDKKLAKKRKAPVARGSGYVAVNTNPWAEVYLGDRKLGDTPGRFKVPAGTHTLRLLPGGKEPAERVKVRVVDGQTVRVSKSL